jgi:hypothetical protein
VPVATYGTVAHRPGAPRYMVRADGSVYGLDCGEWWPSREAFEALVRRASSPESAINDPHAHTSR